MFSFIFSNCLSAESTQLLFSFIIQVNTNLTLRGYIFQKLLLAWNFFFLSFFLSLYTARPSFEYYRQVSVADPGPLMLGVLDRWTPTVNLLQTQIAQISFHIELCPIEARYSISLYTTPLSIWLSGFGDFFQFILFKKANVAGA